MEKMTLTQGLLSDDLVVNLRNYKQVNASKVKRRTKFSTCKLYL